MTTRSEREILDGEDHVYPGHGLVIAYIIMHVFDSPAAALATTEHGWPEALSSSAVPGSGDGAYAGCGVIEWMLGGMTPEDAADQADRSWRRRVQGGAFGNRLDAGQEQADRFRGRFIAKAKTWIR